jgi:hypothetical protein
VDGNGVRRREKGGWMGMGNETIINKYGLGRKKYNE